MIGTKEDYCYANVFASIYLLTTHQSFLGCFSGIIKMQKVAQMCDPLNGDLENLFKGYNNH